MKSFDDILNRNHRVELDKAWETSYIRRGIIAVITYLVAVAFMKSIGIDAFLLNALVPTSGYIPGNYPACLPSGKTQSHKEVLDGK